VQALDLKPGDEVVTTPFTFVAPLNAVLEAGATARFVDIRHDDFTLDPSLVGEAIGPATRAIMPVHLYGHPADMNRLAALADEWGLAVIEDAAQAHGAMVCRRPVGSFGIGAFSFYATKSITTGEGGMLTTSDERLARRLRLLGHQGMRARYDYELPGHNYRMTELQAALGISGLQHLEEYTVSRRRNAAALLEGLAEIEGIELPTEQLERRHVYHLFTIRVTRDCRLTRDELAAALAARCIETAVNYPRALPDYDCYWSHPQVLVSDVPEAKQAASEVLSLPVHPWLDRDELDQIVDAVRDAIG
jgi:dTDP-4-amino-4,6-dideoxygalactose transaminase